MIGNVITDFTVEAVGTNGYVIVADLGGQRIEAGEFIILQKGGVLSPVLDVPVTLMQLLAYPESDSAPVAAWAQRGNKIYVFCTSADYPYDGTVSIAFGYSRSAATYAATSDALDYPDDAGELVRNMALQMARQQKGVRVGFEIEESIRRARAGLGV